MPRTTQFSCAVALLLWVASSAATQELFTDFESGLLESWQVNGSTIELVGVPTWTAEPNSYRWFYFGADGMRDKHIDFEIPASSFLGSLAGHRFVWSYDQQNWSFFDNNHLIGNDLQFRNDIAFTEDRVFVAYSTPYTVTQMSQHVAELSDEWFVSPTATGNADLEVSSVQDLPLYGYRITHPLLPSPLSEVDKIKVVLVGGNHSGEPGGNHALEGFLNFLTSDDDRASAMRVAADFYVYPMADPLGRSEGFYRGNSQNPANDHNRFWDSQVSGDNGGFTEIDLLTTAMQADTGADVDYALDFHGFFDSGNNFIFTDTPGRETQFVRELEEFKPPVELVVDDDTSPAGIFEFWAKTPQGLNADFAFTPEFSPNQSADDLRSLGRDYAIAFHVELGSPSFETSANEIDTLTEILDTGISDLLYDFNRDGTTNLADRDFFIREVTGSLPGDTDLNGKVEFVDFLVLSNNFGVGVTWAKGDFDGNGLVAFADFLQLSENFGQTAIATVPEPSSGILFLLSVLCLRAISARAQRRI